MSLNVSGSTKVIVILKSLAKTASKIGDAEHRVPSHPPMRSLMDFLEHFDTRRFVEILTARVVVASRPKVLPT